MFALDLVSFHEFVYEYLNECWDSLMFGLVLGRISAAA